MLKQYGLLCLALISHLTILNAAIIPLRSLVPATSTYKPSTLILPPGFDSQKAPRQPMLYPYAVSSSGIPTRTKIKNIPITTTPGWIPVALRGKSDLPLLPTLYATTPTHPVPAVLEDRISNHEHKYSSPSYKEGLVFESIVYGTWKPDPPLQPIKILNVTKQQHYNRADDAGVGDGTAYNKTINRQHGGFIGNIQQKPSKVDKQISFSSTSSPVGYKLNLQRKVRKQGRRKIRPNTSTIKPNSNESQSNMQETTTTTTATTTTPKTIIITTANENAQNVKIVKVNSSDPKLTEVAKQINESIEIKYNHKQTSMHSIDVTATADANDNDEYVDDDQLSASNTLWHTHSQEFFSTVPQIDYDDDDDSVDIYRNIAATRRSWPTDFMEEPLTTTSANFHSAYDSDDFSERPEIDPSQMPLALGALNIPPSLWPKLPGNITKLGKPYEAESSAEEPALCVPITVQEQNIMNSKELVYIERVFCFPMPPSTTTSENNVNNLEKTFISSTTLKTVTTANVQNIKDFVDSNSRVLNASSIFKNNFYLLTSILVIYFKFFV